MLHVYAPMEVGLQMSTIANHPVDGKQATRKEIPTLGIILGSQRITGTWADVNNMARTGIAVIRDGNAVRLIWSEAYEIEGMQ